MSSTTPRFFWKRLRSRAKPSRRCSRWRAAQAGAPMSSSRSRAAALSARSRTMSVRGRAHNKTAEIYGRFADNEARGHSPLYEALARHVAGDTEVLQFLQTLPEAKRQPNLLLAAVRHLCGTAVDAGDFGRRL